MNIPDELDESPQVNIVPMIDVIFAILTFFIMASLFLTRAESLPVNLPQAQTAQSQQQNKITITIDDAGNVFLDRRPTQIENLAAQVKTSMENQPEALIVINADEKVEHGRVIAVMDEVRTIEGAKLGIATQQPQSNE
jgi:biopolymer transport protein ExbD